MIEYETKEIEHSGKKLQLSTPNWSTLVLASVIPELTKLLDEERLLIEDVASKKPALFKELHSRFSELGERVRRLWGPVNHLNSVGETEELHRIIEEGERMIALSNSHALMHEGLYRAYVSYREHSDEYKALGKEEKKIIDDRIVDFELGGVALSPEHKIRMTEIATRLSAISTQIESNVKGAVADWSKYIESEVVLNGVPEAAKQAMQRAATAKGHSGWLLTLHAPIFGPVIAHATDRGLREELYRAFVTRASDQGPHDRKYDNSQLINETLSLRDEQAKLLGFTDFAELALKKRMAPSADKVKEFLSDLATKAKPKAKEEFAALEEFARGNLGIEHVEAWDYPYVAEKLEKARYDLSQEELRPYFGGAKVLEGVFGLVNRLYGARVEEMSDVSTWRPDVKFFALYDREGELRGGFYADLFARDGKNQGAWMDIVLEREERDGVTQVPVAYLNCNFTEPKEGEDFQLLHGEVETIFHEFGHVLHHLFSRTKNPDSSMNGVEWDAVECPSQVNENWAWERSMLVSLSRHKDTHEPLPATLTEKLIAAKHHLTAVMLLRQIEFALVDLRLHTEKGKDPLDVLLEVRKDIRVTPTIPEDRFLSSFTHIFSGGYAAGYYSYLWAEVLASDLFEAFTETGDPFNKEVGARFLTSVLEVGSSRPFMESYKEFREREPSPDALLRLRGLA
jgi:oligopeptidase A